MALGLPWLNVEMIGTFIAWLVLNLGLNYYNKWVVSETNFRFPFLLTTTNKVVGLCVAVTIMYCKKGMPKPQELLEQFMRPLVHAQGIATALNIGLNNWSLMMITLTLNQVLKATVPLPTAALSLIFEGKTFSWQLYGSMAVLVTGCVLAAAGSMGDEEVAGIIICIGSILATAAWTVFSAMLMQSGSKPLDAVSLLFVSGPTTIATLLVFFFSLEYGRLTGFTPDDDHPLPETQMMFLYLFIAAAMASAYDIVHNHFVKITSSMNMAIMGNSKLALLILLSMLTLEREPTPLRLVGVVVSFGGTVWYSVFKLQERPKPAKTVDVASSSSDSKSAPLVGEKSTEASALIKK